MRRGLPQLAAAALVALVLSGCGPAMGDPAPVPTHLDLSQLDVSGTDRNGVEYLGGADALRVVVHAMRSSGEVHVTGDYERAADAENDVRAGAVHLDFAGTASRYVARVTADGEQHEVRVVGLHAAVRTGDAPWQCVAADSHAVRRFAPLLDPTALVLSLLGDGSSLAVSPVHGEPANVDLLLGATQGTSGALTVSAEARALPSRLLVGDGTSSAQFAFSDWGEPTNPELPDEC